MNNKRRMPAMGKSIAGMIAFGLLIGQTPSWAAQPDAFEFFQEEARVVTASRRPQAIREIPMAVDVITSEDIRA